MNRNNYDKILSKRGTEKMWITHNPILAEGQECFVVDKLMTKHGDGKSRFSELPYDGVYTEATLLLTADVNPDTIYRYNDSKTVNFSLIVTGIASSMINNVILIIDDSVHQVMTPVEISNDVKKYASNGVTVDFGSDSRRTFKAIVKLKTDPETQYDSNEIIFNFIYPIYSGPIDLDATINTDTITELEPSLTVHGDIKYIYSTNNKKGILFAYPNDYGLLAQVLDNNGLNIINDFIQQDDVEIDGMVYNIYLFKNPISEIENFNITYKFE